MSALGPLPGDEFRGGCRSREMPDEAVYLFGGSAKGVNKELPVRGHEVLRGVGNARFRY